MPKQPLQRRTFLRSTGVALGLPLLNIMPHTPTTHAAPPSPPTPKSKSDSPDIRRMLAINAPLGIHTPFLFPKTAGKNYETTPYLKPLQKLRHRFSVISGLQHPNVDGGHSAEQSFLTAAPHPGQPSFKNTISVDQFAAEQIGHNTRVASLSLSANYNGLSFTRSGVRIPPETRPSRLFAKLFLEGTEKQKQTQLRRIKDGQSIMDLVREQTKSVTKSVGREDHHTLNQYFSSVRDLEKRLAKAEHWAKLPKPKVDRKPPTDINDRANFTGRMQLMYDLIFLAIQTDSTRLITFAGAGGNEVVSLKGVDDGWHNLSHHGKSEEKIKKLAIIELEEFRLFAEFLRKLEDAREGQHTLLQQTAIIMGSNLGNASSHNNTNLPIIAAGGHFKHGSHLAHNPKKSPPLANLLLSHLQHLNLPTQKFASSTSTLTALKPT